MAQKQHKRNPHAFAPIMKKGGVHEKTNKAKRQKEKMQWRKEAHNRGPFFWVSILLQLQRFSKSNIASPLRSEGSYIYKSLLERSKQSKVATIRMYLNLKTRY